MILGLDMGGAMRWRLLLGEYRVRDQMDLKQEARKFYRRPHHLSGRLEARVFWPGDLVPDGLLCAEARQSVTNMVPFRPFRVILVIE